MALMRSTATACVSKVLCEMRTVRLTVEETSEAEKEHGGCI